MRESENRKKLLLIGSTKGSVHVKNYYHLVKDYFDEILIVSNYSVDFCNSKTVDFSLKNPIKVFQNIKKLRSIMTDFNPTIIHVHQANSFAFITARANNKKYPLVLTAWGSDVLILPQKGGFYKYIVSYSLRKADYITADAQFMADAIKKLGINKKVVIANFGIDYDEVEISEKENIIYSNRLHSDLYNINKIIEGFGGFVKKHPKWKLVVGANGGNTESLKKLAKDILPADSYEFIGFVDKEENKRQYLRAKIWTSVPSSDGTAISLLEAMGYGCIPVVSDLPASKEWITDSENGCVVTKNVATALEKAIDLDLNKLQKINKRIILNKATKEVNKAKFESLYDKIMSKQA